MAAEIEAELAETLGNEDNAVLDEMLGGMSNDEIRQTIRALSNEVRIMNSDVNRIKYESDQQKGHIKDNKEKIKLNKQLPYLVSNVIEIVEPYIDPNENDGAAQDTSLTPECKGVVVKTSTRQTVFLPIPGLVRAEEVVPGELVGTNKVRLLLLYRLSISCMPYFTLNSLVKLGTLTMFFSTTTPRLRLPTGLIYHAGEITD